MLSVFAYVIIISVMRMNLPQRKAIRLKKYDYNTPGVYFITICTKDRKAWLATISVGTGVLDGPLCKLTAYGEIANQQILTMHALYDWICVEKYIIMPNHIHLLLRVQNTETGPSGRPVPTNSAIANFVGTFKRFTNKAYGENIWQSRSYDHVVRDEKDYKEIWKYIDENPAKWTEDRFYVE